MESGGLMSKPPTQQPPKPGPQSAKREAQLAKALRDNLRRRKAAGKAAPAEPSED